jgi:hypothetical protein
MTAASLFEEMSFPSVRWPTHTQLLWQQARRSLRNEVIHLTYCDCRWTAQTDCPTMGARCLINHASARADHAPFGGWEDSAKTRRAG